MAQQANTVGTVTAGPQIAPRTGATTLAAQSSLRIAFVASLLLMLVGSLVAGWAMSGAGAATIQEVKFAGAYNGLYDAYLFVPNGVETGHPAPGILAAHGFNNSKEYMNNTALELARRGYVVLNMDLDCHGMSACSNVPSVPFGTASPNGIGAIDGLKYLRSLDIVDPGNIGLIGMSMGGMAVDAAARAMPDAYQAMFFMDSGCLGPCTTEKNFAISQGTGTEVPPDFGAPNGKASLSMPDAMTSYGTTEPIVPGQVYGSIADGTGKIFYEHFGNHPYSTDDPTSIGNAITWFGMTLKGGDSSIPASNQIWPIKLLGTGAAFVGFVVFLLAFGGLLLRSSLFRELSENPPQYKGNTGGRWWAFAVFTAIVGPLTLLWSFRTAFDANYFKLEPVSTGFAGWLVVQGVITIVVLAAGYYLLARPAGAGVVNYGLTWESTGLEWRRIGKSALLALAVTGTAYVLLWAATAWLKVDFRIWLLTFKVTDLQHMLVMLAYIVPVAIYFVPIAVALHGTLRPKNGEASLTREVVTNAVILTVGLIGLLAWFYIPLTFFGADSNLGPSALGLINAIPLVVILPVVALISTYFFRKTGHVYVGAFTNAVFITWLLVASNTLRGF